MRKHLQGAVLGVLVAALLVAIVHIYETQMSRTPHNLKGHIEIEGGMTANPPVAPVP